MATDADKLFIDVAVEKGYLTEEQAQECFSLQEKIDEIGLKRKVRHLAIEKQYMTREQVLDVRREMLKAGVRPRIGGYEILSKLAEGGMGSVYKAKQISVGRVVALKVLPRKLAQDPEYVQRFHREGRVAARLEHPSIVHVYEFGEERGVYFISMEFVDGLPLSEMYTQEQPLDERLALGIVRQVALGLEYAAKVDVIHRDIKPSNILVDTGGRAKLTDLGLAKRAVAGDTFATRTGAVMGTPHYIAPEQARAEKEVDTRADIYSLGATLFHVVTNQTPFEGESTITIINHHLKTPVPWPGNLNPALSEGCSALIQRMMAKDPADRPQTPEALLGEIDAVLAGRIPTDATQVRCECGKSLTVSGDRAESAGRCEACHREVMIPGDSAPSGQPDVELLPEDEEGRLMAQRRLEYDAFREAIAKNPADARTYVHLARLCEELGSSAEAVDHYKAAYRLDSSLSDVLERIEAIAGPEERAQVESGGDRE